LVSRGTNISRVRLSSTRCRSTSADEIADLPASAAAGMANIPAIASGDKARQNASKIIHDKEYAHLKELVDEIREAEKYGFRNNKNKPIILQISPALIFNITFDLQTNC